MLVTAAFVNAIDYKIGIENHEDFACCPAIHFIDLGINEHQSEDIYFVHIETKYKANKKTVLLASNIVCALII